MLKKGGFFDLIGDEGRFIKEIKLRFFIIVNLFPPLPASTPKIHGNSEYI